MNFLDNLLYMFILGVAFLFFAGLSVWFNKKNIVVLSFFPFFLVAYIVPALIFHSLWSEYDVFEKYSFIVFIGGVSFFLGCIFSKFIPIVSLGFKPIFDIYSTSFFDVLQLRVYRLLFFCSILLILSYIVMGFVPMFADDPLAAKFFRGVYKYKYQKAALPFRFATTVIPLLIPLSITILYVKFNYRLFGVTIICIALVFVSLQRGPIGNAIMMTLLIISSFKSRVCFFWVFLGYIIVMIFGSSLMWFLGLAGKDSSNLLQIISSGAPDVFDQLNFFSAFLSDGEFTYGKTFWGGLVPGNYAWNPSIYTLRILNGIDDVSDISSGGLRLLPPMWGYVSFGDIGCVLIPFFSAVFLSQQIKLLKSHSHNLLEYTLSFVYSVNVLGFFVNFFTMSMYSIPKMIVCFYLYYVYKLKLYRKH